MKIVEAPYNARSGRLVCAGQSLGQSLNIAIESLLTFWRDAAVRNFPVAILFDHCQRAASEVAETIGEVAVVARDERVVAKVAVLAKDGFAQKIVAQRVHAEHIHNRARLNNVSFGLAHLAAVHEQPAVRPDLLWQRHHRRHQESGPVNGVKSDDFFPNKMQIGRPVAALLVIWAADRREIRGECIEPYVKNVRLFAGHRNAPANRRARDAEVLEPALDKAKDFIAARFGLYEIRILRVEIKERLLKRGELKKIILFGDGFGGAAAVRTILSGLHVDIRVVVNAVLSRVVAGIDVTVFPALAEEPLHGVCVLYFRGADEFIALDAKVIPELAPLGGHFRDEYGFRDTSFFC